VHTDPAELGVPRPDGTLRVLRWGRGPRHAVALHGITASAMAWEAVAEDLPTEWSLFAVDLRGRGHSAHLPGPYGWDRHLEDVLATVAHLALEQPVLAGHSLGADLALLIADREPDAFGGCCWSTGGCRCRSARRGPGRAAGRGPGPGAGPAARDVPERRGVLRLLAGPPGPEGRLERVPGGLPALRPDRRGRGAALPGVRGRRPARTAANCWAAGSA